MDYTPLAHKLQVTIRGEAALLIGHSADFESRNLMVIEFADGNMEIVQAKNLTFDRSTLEPDDADFIGKLTARDVLFCAQARQVGMSVCDVHGDAVLYTESHTDGGVTLCNKDEERFHALLCSMPLWNDGDLPKLMPIVRAMYVRERKLEIAGEEANLEPCDCGKRGRQDTHMLDCPKYRAPKAVSA